VGKDKYITKPNDLILLNLGELHIKSRRKFRVVYPVDAGRWSWCVLYVAVK